MSDQLKLAITPSKDALEIDAAHKVVRDAIGTPQEALARAYLGGDRAQGKGASGGAAVKKLTRTEMQARLVELFDRKRQLKAMTADRYEQWRLANDALEACNTELEHLAVAEMSE